MKPILLMIAVTLLAACQTTQGTGEQGGIGEQPNIIIMGEDADKDTIPRNSRIFKRVLDALVNEMNDEGFNVYDETAVTLDHFAQGRVRRTDAEIIDIARSVKRPPIDVAVIYSIYAHAQERGYTNKLHVRIAGRLLNVRSGRRLGNFEVDMPEHANVAPNCGRNCILETVGKNARVLGMDLGVVLTKKLDWLAARSDDKHDKDGDDDDGLASAYSLVFTGFTPDDITSIEEYIVAFRGYEHHRPVSSSLRSAEYWYETKSKSARLNRNLRLMMEHLGYEGRVTFKGSSFQIDKISKRKNR
jgi:hypothetical protein